VEDLPIPKPIVAWIPFIEKVTVALAILAFGWILSRWTNKLLRRAFGSRHFDQALAGFLASIGQYAVLALAVLTALSQAGVQTTSFTVFFGAIALGVATAWNGTLGHLASGVLLLIFRPFDLAQKVTVAGQMGVVSDIGLFATTLLTADNEVIIVPNGAITSGPIINYSSRGTLRGHVKVEVKYGSDVAMVMASLIEAAKRVTGVLPEPASEVSFNGLGPRGLDLALSFSAKADAYPGVVHDVRNAVYTALQKEGIDVPISNVVVTSSAA
jgi:small conductance mechanosensitive channel